MGKTDKRKYTQEFKKQAVYLAHEIGNRRAAHQLGIPEGNLYTWKKSKAIVGTNSIAKKNLSGEHKESSEAELKRLRGEVIELRKVNQILKAAAAFFSQDHLK